MYVTTIARSLGDAHFPLPPVFRYFPLPPTPKHFPLPPQPRPRLSGLGTTAACADAGTGLLIDCWKAAEQKGLGYSLDQAQLAKVATAYQRMTQPNSLAGWVFTGKKMVWRGGPLGDAILPVDYSDPTGGAWAGDGGNGGGWTVPESYVTPPNPLTIAPPTPLPPIIAKPPVVLPSVTAQTLFAAAQLPNAPAIVKQAAAQLPASQASTLGFDTSWFTAQMISGVPNYALVGAGVVILLLLSKRRR